MLTYIHIPEPATYLWLLCPLLLNHFKGSTHNGACLHLAGSTTLLARYLRHLILLVLLPVDTQPKPTAMISSWLDSQQRLCMDQPVMGANASTTKVDDRSADTADSLVDSCMQLLMLLAVCTVAVAAASAADRQLSPTL